MQKVRIGIDIGGTTVKVMVTTTQRVVRSQIVKPTDVRGPHLLINGVYQAIYEALHIAQSERHQIISIGVGVPGQVNPQTGEVRLAVNLNLSSYPLGDAISAEFGCPVYIENDVRAAAVGVYNYLLARASHNFAYVSLGTGVSAGLILGGELYRGSHGMAGEIGHIVIPSQQTVCACGNLGCLETLVSGPAIAKAGERALQDKRETILKDVAEPLAAEHIYQAAKQGDTVALEIINQVGVHLGHALHTLIMAYDVDRIILGGGVSFAGETLLQPIMRAWQKTRQQSPLAATMLRPGIVELVPPHYQAGMWGAIALTETDTPA